MPLRFGISNPYLYWKNRFYMTVAKYISFVFLIGCLLPWGCRDIYEQEKYQHPDWLAGKIYTQITTRPDLSNFSTCLQLTGYDTILDVTGSYTVFAPTNQAFEQWFSQHPEYGGSLENIPPQELENLVERHVLQNGWSLKQLQSLDIYGWIDKNNPDNDEPRGYKRQTIQKDPDKKYFIVSEGQNDRIVDSIESSRYKKVFTSARKYGSLFFDDYLGVNDLRGDDYEFYFDRSYESSSIYYGNSRIVSPEIFAENGFVYEVDRVTDPLFNAEQILQQEYSQFSYNSFRELINLFPEFSADLVATNLQPEAKSGGLFDTLYRLTYPDLLFNLHEELTGPNTSNPKYTVRYQNGLLAPTDAAFLRFLDELVTANSGYPHWPDLESVPLEVKRIIVNAHMTDKPVYRTNIEQGFRNGADDIITIDEANIAHKYYGSNCSFIGLDQSIVPRALSSITGPVYLRPGYSTIRYAMEYAKTLPALKEEGKDYAFYVLSDALFAEDSSLIFEWKNRDLNTFEFYAYDQITGKRVERKRNQLTKMILNQVGVSRPRGYAKKEFIENLAGNFILVNNEENSVSGGLPNMWGYNGFLEIEIHPVQLEEETDNGSTFDVNGWFRTPNAQMYSLITSYYPHFFALIREAGLHDEEYSKFNFTTPGELYTVFIPSNEALDGFSTDTLSKEELEKIVKYHFVRGTRIWTDGSSPDGPYETLSKDDESSTQFTTKYATLNIETGADVIRILDSDGALYTEIFEQENVTNIMVATDMDPSTAGSDFSITGVIHEIDRVLIKQ
jgi:uncharacterized surface protein with fasciclin (FAS1) repeats